MADKKIYEAGIYRAMSSKLETILVSARSLDAAEKLASMQGHVQYTQTFAYVDAPGSE